MRPAHSHTERRTSHSRSLRRSSMQSHTSPSETSPDSFASTDSSSGRCGQRDSSNPDWILGFVLSANYLPGFAVWAVSYALGQASNMAKNPRKPPATPAEPAWQATTIVLCERTLGD